MLAIIDKGKLCRITSYVGKGKTFDLIFVVEKVIKDFSNYIACTCVTAMVKKEIKTMHFLIIYVFNLNSSKKQSFSLNK